MKEVCVASAAGQGNACGSCGPYPELPLLGVDWVASGGFGLRGRRTRVNRVRGGDASPELCDEFLP